MAAAQAETESMVAQSRAAARRRKWWLYGKLSSMRAFAAESKVDVDALRPRPLSVWEHTVIMTRRPRTIVSMCLTVVVFALVSHVLFGGYPILADIVGPLAVSSLWYPVTLGALQRVRARIVVEDQKVLDRATLARAYWAPTLVRGTEPTKGRRGEIKPKPRDDVDVLTVVVKENVEPDGDVMLAVWSGPRDEVELTEPSW